MCMCVSVSVGGEEREKERGGGQIGCAREHMLRLCVCTNNSVCGRPLVSSEGVFVRTPVCNPTALLKVFEHYKATRVGRRSSDS